MIPARTRERKKQVQKGNVCLRVIPLLALVSFYASVTQEILRSRGYTKERTPLCVNLKNCLGTTASFIITPLGTKRMPEQEF